MLREALLSAKSRCSYDSLFHKLFFTLVAAGFHHTKIREQLGEILLRENQALQQSIAGMESPIEGVSAETWAIVWNALIDGLALQALLHKDFPVEKTYSELEHMLQAVFHKGGEA